KREFESCLIIHGLKCYVFPLLSELLQGKCAGAWIKSQADVSHVIKLLKVAQPVDKKSIYTHAGKIAILHIENMQWVTEGFHTLNDLCTCGIHHPFNLLC
ncbi:MAG: hypothetical protein ORN53_07525, partial [Crocinitomicaceae bacterium]|nr:hypothetical protein [Crocinitomicaceae bacterium]